MSFNEDTLDIQPILPVGATPWTPDFAFGNGVLNPGGEKNPEAAAQARARLAAAHHVTRDDAMPIPEAPFQQISPVREPVSPAHHEEVGSTKKATVVHHIKKHAKGNLKPIINAVASFLLLVLIFKAPVLYNQIKYLTSNPTPQSTGTLPVVTDTPVKVSNESLITIPKINVKAPIVYETALDDPTIDRALENGVVHYGFSAMPGEVGNNVIVGHSSNDWWQPGNYKFVFVLLGKLTNGDDILVNYQGTQYRYQVTEHKIVEATDVSVLAPTGDPELTLITCWPAGTNLKREIIRAKQISPVPGSTPAKIAKTQDAKNAILPGSSPSFTQQISDFWHSITRAFSQKATEVKAD